MLESRVYRVNTPNPVLFKSCDCDCSILKGESAPSDFSATRISRGHSLLSPKSWQLVITVPGFVKSKRLIQISTRELVADWLYYRWKEVSAPTSHRVCCPLKCHGLAINSHHWKEVCPICPRLACFLVTLPGPEPLPCILKAWTDNTRKGGERKHNTKATNNRSQADKPSWSLFSAAGNHTGKTGTRRSPSTSHLALRETMYSLP